jgi:hypothetical protein
VLADQITVEKTLTKKLPPVDWAVIEEELSSNIGVCAACVIVTFCVFPSLLKVINAEREKPEVFGGAENVMLALPVPDNGLTETHALVTVCTVHEAVVMTIGLREPPCGAIVYKEPLRICA